MKRTTITYEEFEVLLKEQGV